MSPLNQDNNASLGALAPARQRVYAFLSAAFSEPPTAEGLATIRVAPFVSCAPEILSEETLVPLRQFAASVAETPELERQARQEFMNLFKVPGGQYVTPYESVFRDTREIAGRQTKGLLMGQSAADVRKWYCLAAVEISDEFKDLPDHICLELDFVAHLCVKELESVPGGDGAKLARAREMQRDFLAGHVVPWIGALRDKIHEKSQHLYFRAIADMAVEFTARDLATLEGALGPSNRRSVPQYENDDP